MSRRLSSSAHRTPTSPYSRRPPNQPKSTRQQFSACGACRMRRVRCDLKNFGSATSSDTLQQPSCSNCRERNIRCVDEFAEVKAVKLLRRGRRLQQVEARYGKVSDAISSVSQLPTPAMSALAAVTTTQSCIPEMQLPFLKSSFFRRFCVQRPIIEPGEFTSRYLAHVHGTAPLDIQGRMLVMLLVTWAASFGIDEFGNEDAQHDASESHTTHPAIDDANSLSDSKRHATLLRTEAMIKEILSLVDIHGLLRRPSWDGVRILLLLLPLAHDIQNPLEYRVTYEATLSQVTSLCCDLDNSPSVDSGLGPYCDELIRARIFWYAYVHEGITMGLDGKHLVLNDGDLATFQNTLPPQFCALAAHSISTADSPRSSTTASSPVSPTFPFTTPLGPSHPRASLAYLVTTQYFSLALSVSQACRAIHSTLTGPHARQRIESGHVMRKEAIIAIWDELEHCWENFETLRRNPSGVGAAGGDLIRGEDVERFVSGWQLFIFGCLNAIREALRSHTENNRAISDHALTTSLYVTAIQRCQTFLPRVVETLQRHLKVPSSFFAYETGLIRDGCFFAGTLLAQSDKLDTERSKMRWDADWEEGMAACLQALSEVRWVYAHSQEQETTLKAEWEARIERDINRQQARRSPTSFPIKESPGHSPCLGESPLPCATTLTCKPRALSLLAAGGQVRPHLPPLSVTFPADDSGPETALTDDSSANWEPYTPPSTSGSMTGTVTLHGSLSPVSPSCHLMTGTMRTIVKEEDSLFMDDSDTEPFSSVVGRTPNSRSTVRPKVQPQWTPPLSNDYLDPRVILATDTAMSCDGGFPTLGSHHRTYLS